VDDKPSAGEDLVQDPFCRTYVPKSQAYVREIEGRQQFFCSRECCEKYLSDKK
jgi:YHS domain-containing protein